MKRALVIVVVMVCYVTAVPAQVTSDGSDSLSSFFQFDDPPPLSCLFTYFPPFFIEHGIELKWFIRSKTFRKIRERYGDPRAVDAIFIRAMQMTNNNTAVSLLLATIACMDHQIVGLKAPIFALYFPLSNESEQEFNRRMRNLPAQLYKDTPSTPSGDRDKLQHFFGSTFLTFVFESRQPAERIGDFIEQGEDAFIVDGVLDDRDIRANRQGQEFGLALLDDNHRLPSDFLKYELAGVSLRDSTQFTDQPTCSGIW
ncbi:MAG: hypothetical protein HYR76_03870 [Ignavibacteria bacterium]|nr:hypothetical protein [Ignavibacteria bacterium]MBI3765134.1 hypothetical protein [Ignavibacteriales bacterium]